LAHINDKFAAAIKHRLNGQAETLSFDVAGGYGLVHARQAQIAGETVLAAAAEVLGIPFEASLKDKPVSNDFLTSVPIAFARRCCVVGLCGDNGVMQLAIGDLAQWQQSQTISKMLRRQVELIFVPPAEILRTINVAYQQRSSQAQQVIQELDHQTPGMDQLQGFADATSGNEDLLDVASRAPVIKLVNLMLFEAVKRRVSDVHVQPYENRLVVRFRIDGVMHDVFSPPKALQEEIVSRIKVMGGMNIAERRLAQDGRATVEVGDRVVDLRIASLPTSFGERAVIRLLDKGSQLYRLGELGMPAKVLTDFQKLIRADHGIILVTGPTGSGKSTTLYASLQEISSQEYNIITLEDPIEYRLEGISQTQVSDKKGMTFASGLRHVLRQDPDIIMVGEIRDAETAHMAIQSALTGHLVFSTLHTNDAAGAVARMLDLGVEPYLLASSLLGVMAQRLVRKICPNCRKPYEATQADVARWGSIGSVGSVGGDIHSARLFKGLGCDECMQTGFRERMGIFELLTVNEAIRDQILHRAKASSIKSLAAGSGMVTLRSAGIAKAMEGSTTMDEVTHVTGLDDF
jgi:general secretion pathway protein E